MLFTCPKKKNLLLSNGLNFVLTCNNIHKATLKFRLNAFENMLQLNWHFCNDGKDLEYEKYKWKSTFDPCLQDKFIKIDLTDDKYKNLPRSINWFKKTIKLNLLTLLIRDLQLLCQTKRIILKVTCAKKLFFEIK